MRMSVAALMAVAAALAPRLAEACPMCVSQQPGGAARIVALASMILVPFAIAWVVFRALRQAGGAGADAAPERPTATHAGSQPASAMGEPRP